MAAIGAVNQVMTQPVQPSKQVEHTQKNNPHHERQNESVQQSKQQSSVKQEELHYGNKLSAEAKQEISKLKATELKVKAHEQAHQSVGGQFAGGISYDTQKGPDGQQYITGGEVPISMPKTDDPEETIQAMEQVRRAALAPANPSSQDMQVAAKASQQMMEAQAELKKQSQSSEDEAEQQADHFQRVQQLYANQQAAVGSFKPETIFDETA